MRAMRRFAPVASRYGTRGFSAGAESSGGGGGAAAVALVVGAGAGAFGYYQYDQSQPKTGIAEPHKLKLILFGAPGSGKGTQCEKLTALFGVKHISTGDLLREHVKNGTALGKQAKEFMDKGALVPDSLVIDLLKDAVKDAPKGWIIDGMPRTAVQAEFMQKEGLVPDCFLTLDVPDSVLEERIAADASTRRPGRWLVPDCFLTLDVPDSVLEERICGRRLDPETGAIYHLKFKPPPKEIVSRLTHRSDDTADKLKNRLKAYHDNLDSVLGVYRSANLYTAINANRNPDAVYGDLVGNTLKARLNKWAGAVGDRMLACGVWGRSGISRRAGSSAIIRALTIGSMGWVTGLVPIVLGTLVAAAPRQASCAGLPVKAYHDNLDSVLGVYRSVNLYTAINANRSPDAVYGDLVGNTLKARLNKWAGA
eukprot:CAMPEP_0204449258 /NCGR_PEP_ID=MMETSP0470-20130426/99746_1 /ASSEMBLY_ACC=CAM_ASM_000385 /TAXON_ID=2969 /ORGANISM="Oxyrrhis marina" /LENGTH=423 /DNA_ID=CAMNT_0051449073 /DNA_START=44 /DNA_END=1315 /DNA_ORIENTATION=-